ncbi:MAG: hypothetical protein FJX34_01570 [Alphaproteobacteria bacterium]|nr:hypothetical protein [Alphaproteobacteria bacterium]
MLLLSLFLLIPLTNCAISFQHQSFQTRFASGLAPVLFFVVLIGITRVGEGVVDLFAVMPGISFVFHFDKMALIFLFLLNFLWLVLAFYLQHGSHKPLRIFLAFSVLFLSMIFASSNFFTMLVGYSGLALTGLVFFKSLALLRNLQLFFVFVATVVAYRFQDLGLVLYCAALLLPMLFFTLNLELLAAYALSALFIFTKIYTDFARLDLLAYFVISCTAVALVPVLFTKDLRTSFRYLFLQQFFFTIFGICLFGNFDRSLIYLPVLAFSLAITLVFFCISNLSLYLMKSGQTSIRGLFHQMPASSSLLIFALASMAGFLPTIGATEKFFLIKLAWNHRLLIPAILVVSNSLLLLLFAGKMFFYFVSISKEKISEVDSILARDLDLDSNLIMTASATAVLMLVGVVVTKIF